MCIILLAWKVDARRDLIVAANRDEFFDRPTAPARFWNKHLLGGRDLRSGGAQLAVSRRSGRFAAVTNVRSRATAVAEEQAPLSRGSLVTRFLESEMDTKRFLDDLSRTAEQYNGFNLLLADEDTCWYYSNVTKTPLKLEPGAVYGLCNHHCIDPDWPKVHRGKAALQSYLDHHIRDDDASSDREGLFRALSDRTVVTRDADLPTTTTGFGVELERALSPLFVSLCQIHGKPYGTRSSTVVERRHHHPTTGAAEKSASEREAVGKTTTINFCERTFSPSGDTVDTVEYTFTVGKDKIF